MEKNVEKNVVVVEEVKEEMKEVKFDEMVMVLKGFGLNNEGEKYLREWYMVRWTGNVKKGGGRKDEMMRILEGEKMGISVKELGSRLGISCANVSSVLLYLRKDGIEIVSIDGKKILKKYLGNLVK